MRMLPMWLALHMRMSLVWTSLCLCLCLSHKCELALRYHSGQWNDRGTANNPQIGPQMIAEPKVIPTMIGLKRTKPITLNQRHNPQGRTKPDYISRAFFFSGTLSGHVRYNFHPEGKEKQNENQQQQHRLSFYQVKRKRVSDDCSVGSTP